MTAEVNNVLAQLAVIQREIADPISGRAIVAFDNVPLTISRADMPLFVNFVGALSGNTNIGSDYDARDFNETRNFFMNLYHSPYGAGVEGEMSGLLTPYFSLVYNLFGKYPHLKQLGGVLDAKITADSGVTVLKFLNQDYLGVRFTLQVISKNRRILGEDE